MRYFNFLVLIRYVLRLCKYFYTIFLSQRVDTSIVEAKNPHTRIV